MEDIELTDEGIQPPDSDIEWDIGLAPITLLRAWPPTRNEILAAVIVILAVIVLGTLMLSVAYLGLFG